MTETNSRGSKTRGMILLILLVSAFLLAGHFFRLDQSPFESLLRRVPPALSAVVFILLYVVLTFLIWLGPKDVLRIAAAYAYGLTLSTLLILVGELINAAVLFTMSRRLGRSFVEQKMKGRMARLDRWISETSFFGIFFLKFPPVIPFRFLDLGFGLTGISLKKYLLISLLASPLRIFMVQMLICIGLETVTDPARFSAYLQDHPQILLSCCAYFFGSIIVMGVIQKMRRHFLDEG